MKHLIGWLMITGFTLCCALSYGSEVDLKPLNSGVAVELGNLINATDQTSDKEFASTTHHRTIGWFAQEAVVDERLFINVGMGGMFLYIWPGEPGTNFSGVRAGAVGLSHMSGTYHWGEVEDPKMQLTLGLFPYKYNKNSKNLGEYLFRSQAYPGLLYTGWWNVINNAQAEIWGAKYSIGNSKSRWRNDILLTFNTTYVPLYDMALSYVTNLKFGGLEIGAGVNFDYLIPFRPSKTTPEFEENAHFTSPITFNTPFTNDSGMMDTMTVMAGQAYSNHNNFNLPFVDKVVKQDSSVSNEVLNPLTNLPDQALANQLLGTQLDYYSFKSTKFMGRFSLNITEMVKGEQGPGDFKLYAEAIVLGVKDYPVFYEKIENRIPLMFGVDFPTFGMLDMFSIEFEYWKNRFLNNNNAVRERRIPLPETKAKLHHTIAETDDDFKWTLYMTKRFMERISLTIQVASDHQRPIHFDFSPKYGSALIDKNSWYYMFRLQAAL